MFVVNISYCHSEGPGQILARPTFETCRKFVNKMRGEAAHNKTISRAEPA